MQTNVTDYLCASCGEFKEGAKTECTNCGESKYYVDLPENLSIPEAIDFANEYIDSVINDDSMEDGVTEVELQNSSDRTAGSSDAILIALWDNLYTRLVLIFGILGTIVCATTPFDIVVLIMQWSYLGYFVFFVLLAGSKEEFQVTGIALVLHVIFCFICYYIPDLV